VNRKEIRIAGFGGQGVILLGAILGKAASVYDNGYAALIQNYGPESRGGSCRAEVVISDEPIDYPYITNPQIIVALSREAYSEFATSVSPDTLVIIDSDLVKVALSNKHKPFSIPCSRMAKDLGRPVVANIIMLGFMASVSEITSLEAIRKAIIDSVPVGTEEFNIKAFNLGYDYGIENDSKVKSRHA
jgi:2-oxoglutarate ferredoxin oxidoreductase subunit gamma